MVDDVLRCNEVPKPTKTLANQILDEITTSGNEVASLRRTELKDLQGLAVKLWKKYDQPRGKARQPHEEKSITQTVAPQNLSDKPEQINDRSHNLASVPEVSNTATEITSLPAQQDLFHEPTQKDVNSNVVSQESYNLTEPSQQDEDLAFEGRFGDSTIRRFSTTSSQELATNFDLAGDEMLLLADQIDVDALEETLDFDLNGDYHWILNDTPS